MANDNKNGLFGIVAAAAIGAMISLSGWTLLEIINLKVKVAEISTKLDMHMDQPQKPAMAKEN